MALATWASELARELLAEPLPRRWAHTQGVARQARTLAPILGDDADLLEAAAWLHDIGYTPALVVTGFHPLDGARYLRDTHQASPRLCNLVAHHSYAVIEARILDLANPLIAEFPGDRPHTTDALLYCDMTTTPAGLVTTVKNRIGEIVERYGPEHSVRKFIERGEVELVRSVDRVDRRLKRNLPVGLSQKSMDEPHGTNLIG
jgi:HD domain